MSRASQPGLRRAGTDDLSGPSNGTGGAAGRVSKRRSGEWFSRWGTLVVFGLLIVVGIIRDHSVFLSWGNATDILVGASFPLLIALGLTVILICGEFDLSIAAVATLAGVTAVSLFARWEMPIGVGVMAGLGAAALVGLINGLLVTRLRIHSFIATLGMSTILIALSYVLTAGRIQQAGAGSSYVSFARSEVWGLGIPAIVAIVIAVLLASVMKHTAFGRHLYAVGGNRNAAYLAGIRVRRIVVAGFVVGALVASIGGILLSMHLGYGDINLAGGYLLPAFAAAFIGAATVQLGTFHVWGTVVGAYMLQVVLVLVILLGLPPELSLAFQGLVLIIAVSLASLSSRAGQNNPVKNVS